MSHTHAAGPAVFFWSLVSVFCITLLWIGVVPKVRAAAPDGRSNVLSIRVTGEFASTLEKARDNAIEEAQERLGEALRKFDPPVDRVPELTVIRDAMVVSWSRPEQETLPSTQEVMFRFTIDVELKPDQLQALRREERIIETAWLIGGATLLLSVAALFFRFEEWTKGFLTRWLVAGAAAVIGLFAAVWWFIKS